MDKTMLAEVIPVLIERLQAAPDGYDITTAQLMQVAGYRLEDFEFTLLYGEVGNTGTDDPHISLPFYRKIDGTEYNQEKRLRFSLEKKAALDGLDCFKYVIEKRG